MTTSQLCSTFELKALIKTDSVKVLDCSWFLPNQDRSAKAEFKARHIVDAQFFDIDAICDQTTDLPHMLPTSKEFATSVSKLGISNHDFIVVYDSIGLFSAARVWWMFKVFGHDSVQILDGGLPAWITADGETSDQTYKAETGSYTATLNREYVADKIELISNCSSAQYLVLDARPSARFLGQAPEPRPGLPSGHMPNSVSLPYGGLVEGGKLKPQTQLRKLFTELGITDARQVITSCGSGVTAAIITLALAESGLGLKRLYDGAWAEWGSADDTIIL